MADKRDVLRGPDEGQLLGVGFTQVRLVITGEDTGGAFAVSEQPLGTRALAGPLHRHDREDGFIHVVEGSVGAQVDDRVVHAPEGGTVLVPRGTRHTFWNDADAPAKVLELFSPAGLEGWFKELAEIVSAGSFSLDDIAESGRRFGTHLEFDSLGELLDAHGLRLPGL